MKFKTCELTNNFEAGRIDPQTFSHEAHLQVAYDMVQKYEFMEAAIRYIEGIKCLAASVGMPEKFNLTVTLAFLGIVSERVHQKNYHGFDDFLDENPDLMSRSLLKNWYTEAQLGSDLARNSFILPDKAA